MTNYEEYGQLMIQSEIINNRIAEVKRRIAEELKNPKTQPAEKPKKE